MSQISGPAVLRWLLHPGPRLSQRVLHAGSWAFALRITLRVFSTVRTIILARLLAPADFGLMGIALLMLSLLETFTETGFRAALIQRQGDIRPYLDTAWTIHILRGLLLAGGLVLAAPLMAGFFNAPEAALIVRVMAISALIQGFNNIGIVYFQKELEFQKRFLYEVAGVVPQVAVGIGLAFALQNVWALVYGTLAGSAAQLVASFVLHPYRPRPRLDWARAGELFNFGKWVFGSHILVYGLRHLDSLVVGKVLGPAALGLYQMAHSLSQMVSTEITSVVNQVAFPAYSKLQDRQEKLREAYLRSLQFIASFSFPLAGGLFITAPHLVQVVLGDKWLSMVPAFQFLIIWGLFVSLSASSGPLFQGVGRPDLATKLQFVKLLIIGIAIYPMTREWGLVGAGSAVVAATLLVDGVAVYVVTRLVHGSAWDVSRALGYPVLNTLLMLLALFTAQQVLGPPNGLLQLAGLVGLGVLAYGVGVAASWKAFGYNPGVILNRKFSV